MEKPHWAQVLLGLMLLFEDMDDGKKFAQSVQMHFTGVEYVRDSMLLSGEGQVFSRDYLEWVAKRKTKFFLLSRGKLSTNRKLCDWLMVNISRMSIRDVADHHMLCNICGRTVGKILESMQRR